MPFITCPHNACDWNTGENTPEVILYLAQAHEKEHQENHQKSLSLPQPERTEKVKRPTISVGCIPEAWSFFEYAWKDFKVSANISEERRVSNLMQCCDDALHKDLFRLYGDPNGSTEDQILQRIKKHAVHTENVIIARVTHQQMKQDRDEPVRNFVARLKGQGGICSYNIEHECQCKKKSNVSYADEMVRNILASGLADNDIQRELFSDANQEMTLEQMINFIESKEAGKRSASQITSTVKTCAVRSTYKRDANQAIRNHTQNKGGETTMAKNTTIPCRWCGRRDHDLGFRKQNCPAFNHICKICGIRSHYEKVCRRNSAAHQPRASTIYMDHEDHSPDLEILIELVHHQAYNQEF